MSLSNSLVHDIGHSGPYAEGSIADPFAFKVTIGGVDYHTAGMRVINHLTHDLSDEYLFIGPFREFLLLVEQPVGGLVIPLTYHEVTRYAALRQFTLNERP
jgi:hypothetical protein